MQTGYAENNQNDRNDHSHGRRRNTTTTSGDGSKLSQVNSLFFTLLFLYLKADDSLQVISDVVGGGMDTPSGRSPVDAINTGLSIGCEQTSNSTNSTCNVITISQSAVANSDMMRAFTMFIFKCYVYVSCF